MNYRMYIFTTLAILASMHDGVATLSAQSFPVSGADITFSQKINIHTDGYIPYRDSVVYNGITIEAPPAKSSQSDTTAATNTPTKNNGTAPAAPNAPQPAPTPYASDTNDDSAPAPAAPDDPRPAPPTTPPRDTERRECFARDTDGAKRFVPPRVTDAPAYWWVGDSRFTGMYINGVIGRNNNEAVVAYAAKGHQWLTASPSPTGISLLKTCLRDGDVVILNLGANDIWKHDSYISTYRRLISDYPNVIFKVMSVNPVCDSKARLQNTQIETFNTKLKNAFPSNFVDTYSIVKPMVSAENTDSEGLHYRGGNIEQTIYNTVMSSVSGT